MPTILQLSTNQAARDSMELPSTYMDIPQVEGALPRLGASLKMPETTNTSYLPAILAGNVGGVTITSAIGTGPQYFAF